MKTITYNPETHVLVPIEPSDEMLRKAIKVDLGKDCDEKGICINLYQVMLAAAPQPEPNHNWCAGCSPDNCSGCGAEPAAYIFKPNNELLWPHEVDQNVFASDPEDYDKLYTTPQPDRVAELEAETTKLKLDLLTSYGEAEALVAELAKENKPVDIDLRKDRWNQIQICTWIGNKLMSQPAMFERHEVCRFVRNLGRSEVLAKLIEAAPKEK